MASPQMLPPWRSAGRVRLFITPICTAKPLCMGSRIAGPGVWREDVSSRPRPVTMQLRLRWTPIKPVQCRDVHATLQGPPRRALRRCMPWRSSPAATGTPPSWAPQRSVPYGPRCTARARRPPSSCWRCCGNPSRSCVWLHTGACTRFLSCLLHLRCSGDEAKQQQTAAIPCVEAPWHDARSSSGIMQAVTGW